MIYAGAIAALRADAYPAGYVAAAVDLVLRGIVRQVTKPGNDFLRLGNIQFS